MSQADRITDLQKQPANQTVKFNLGYNNNFIIKNSNIVITTN